MKTKKSFKKVIIPLIILVILVAGAGVAYMLMPRDTTSEKASTASFEFDGSQAPGWFAGANIYPDESYDKPQATVTRIIAQGTAEKPEGNCFVQFSYWANNAKNLNQALKDDENYKDSEFVLLPAGVLDSAIKVGSKDVPYELHQYNLIGQPNQQMSRGQQIAYLKAGSGYIQIRGYCLTTEELTITAPVFSAVSLKE